MKKIVMCIWFVQKYYFLLLNGFELSDFGAYNSRKKASNDMIIYITSSFRIAVTFNSRFCSSNLDIFEFHLLLKWVCRWNFRANKRFYFACIVVTNLLKTYWNKIIAIYLKFIWHFQLLMKYNSYDNLLFFGTNSTPKINDGRYIHHQIENIFSDKGMSQNLLKINILSAAICQSTYFHTREPCHSSNNIIYFLFHCLTFFSNLFIY